jgi:hypothetical protein
MADEPNGWLDAAAPFWKAVMAAGGVGGASALWWARDWWRRQQDQRAEKEERRDRARMDEIYALDKKSRALLDRMEKENASLRSERDAKDREIAELRFKCMQLRVLVQHARQVAEGALLQTNLPFPKWEKMPPFSGGGDD